MKPQNSKERRSSIWKFILLFNQIPLHENQVWRERSEKIEKDIEFQETFYKEMKDIRAHVDSLDIKGQNLQLINGLLTQKLVKLQTSIPKEDETFRYDMYKEIIDAFVDIQELKGALNKLDDVGSKLKQYEEQNRELTNELERANRYLDAYRNN